MSAYPTVQLRRLARIRNGADYKEVEDPEGDYPVYGSGGPFSKASRYLYEGPAVLLGRKGTIDRPILVDGQYWTVDTMFCAQPEAHVDPRFLYYACTTIPFGMFSTNTALPSMSQSDLKAVTIPHPQAAEQARIADFLDRETAKIDTLIAKQEQLIATLQEDRIATIIDAVTRGVSRGTKGLPEKWTMTQLKWVGRLVTGKTPSTADPRNFSDSVGRPWFRPEDYDPAGRESQASMFISNLGQRGIPVLTGESVHVVSIGATLGKIGYVRGSCSTNQQVTAVENPPNAKFLYYALVAQRQNIWAASMGNTLPIISAGRLGALRFPWPPVDEQTYLVAQLDERTDEFDHVIEKTRQAITILREYRSAVITNSVTGKLDVREMV